MDASLVDVARRPLLMQILCDCIPHSMHPRSKLSCFLRLRATCRATIQAVSSPLRTRVRLLLRHPVQEVRDAATRITDSGFLFQLLLCGGRPAREIFLMMDSTTGIPLDMTQTYWDKRQRLRLETGWKIDSQLVLRL